MKDLKTFVKHFAFGLALGLTCAAGQERSAWCDAWQERLVECRSGGGRPCSAPESSRPFGCAWEAP